MQSGFRPKRRSVSPISLLFNFILPVMHTLKRRLSLFTVLLSGVVLFSAVGCGSSNPNISAAEDALEDENYKEALASIEKEISANPKNGQAYLVKGNILGQQAQSVQDPERRAKLLKQMRTAYDNAIQRDSGLQGEIDAQLLNMYQQEFSRGVKAYNRAQKADDPAAYREAAGYLAGAAQVRPDSARASLFEAFAYINAGDTEQAVDPMQRAVEAGADSASNYVLLSQLYQQANQTEEAVAMLEEATQQYPDNAELQSQLLNAYVRAGQTEQAMSAYKKAIESEPQNPTYRYNYGSMLLNADQYDAAIEQLNRALEIDPNNINAQYNLGAAYVNKAVGVNEQIVKLDSTLSANQEEMSEQEMKDMQAKMKKLAQQRSELFKQAIEPLVAARKALQSGNTENSSLNEEQICYSLYQAYAQTNQMEKAKQVEACAGLNE